MTEKFYLKMKNSKISKKILTTLGPSSLNEKTICRLDEMGVDMFRLNLSHIQVDQIESMVKLIRKYSNVPICLDTEGAQVRTGAVQNGKVHVKEGDVLTLRAKEIIGDQETIYLTPDVVLNQLKVGDLISIDYDTALLRVIALEGDDVRATVLYDGTIASNKGVSIVGRKIHLPALTHKDLKAIEIGLGLDINYFALSFANCKKDVEQLRGLCKKEIFLISKVENHTGLTNLEDIIATSDAVLIDRGDLSKEASIINIPFLQKMIIKKANDIHTEVYVATNLLESMIDSRSPTRAEVNDVINTLIDGADGLVLAAETAVGQHPVGSVSFIRSLIKQYERYCKKGTSLNTYHDNLSYLLLPPHGGVLVDRLKVGEDDALQPVYDHKFIVDDKVLMDCEQIANGGYSPLRGFMMEEQFHSVLKNYYLPKGDIWTIPIILQTTKSKTEGFQRGHRIALVNQKDDLTYAILRLEDIFKFDFKETAKAWFKTDSLKHPGVKMLHENGEFCLGGKIDLIRKLKYPFTNNVLSPIETRAIFDHKGWTKIVGFHTRNVIHRAHEYIQMAALANHFADGLFVHPLIGPKKQSDFSPDIIIKSYQIMTEQFYPKGKVLFSVFPSYPRYAGPREAVFTALCRKNYGCSHFIVGRDHSGVGEFYGHSDAKELFIHLKGLGIEPVFFDKVHYCKMCDDYVEKCSHSDKDLHPISGSQIREIFQEGKRPEDWQMRKEISTMIEEALQQDKEIFIK